MRVTTVEHSRTELECSKCGTKIRASRDEKQDVVDRRTGKKKRKTVRVLGDSYRWIKFNRGAKVIRCMSPKCGFMPSDMTTSDKLSRVYAAQEAAEETVSDWDFSGDVSELKQALDDLASEVRAVSEEYEESASNMEQAFPNGSSKIDEIREKADSLSSWADEIEGVDFEEWDGPEDEEGKDVKNTSDQTREEWGEEQREAAEAVLSNCPV